MGVYRGKDKEKEKDPLSLPEHAAPRDRNEWDRETGPTFASALRQPGSLITACTALFLVFLVLSLAASYGSRGTADGGSGWGGQEGSLHPAGLVVSSVAPGEAIAPHRKNLAQPMNNTDQQLTLVLPLIFEDVARSTLLIHSLRRNFPRQHVREMIVIAPEAEASVLQGLFALPWPVRVLNEVSLLPVAGIERLGGLSGLYAVLQNKEKFGRGPKYYLQMALKLWVAREVRTRFYLVLDADVVMLYPLPSIDVLLPEKGKAAFLVETRESHEKWWANTEAMFQLPACNDSYLFGVTPAILAKDISLLVVRHLESLYNYDVLPTLLFPNTSYRGYTLPYPSEGGTPCWTEYAAYRTLACTQKGLFDRYHVQPPKPYILYGGFWYTDDFLRSPDACTWGAGNPYKPVFCVVQTHTGVTVRDAFKHLSGFLSR